MSSREKSHLTSEGFDRLIRGKSKEVIESAEHFVGCMPLTQSESPCQSSNRHSQQQRDNVPYIRPLIWQFRRINNHFNVVVSYWHENKSSCGKTQRISNLTSKCDDLDETHHEALKVIRLSVLEIFNTSSKFGRAHRLVSKTWHRQMFYGEPSKKSIEPVYSRIVPCKHG